MPRSMNMQVVADAAGVSKSAVSLALRNDPRLAAATRRRVQEVAARLGYRKNPIVASLMAQLRVSQTPRFQANLALINCSSERTLFDRHGFGQLRRGIRDSAGKAGFGVDEFWADEPGRGARRFRQILQARNIKGLIAAMTPESKSIFDGHEEFLVDFCVVAVGVGRTDPTMHRAANNHFRTAQQAVEAAVALGYARPGLMLPEAFDRAVGRRYSAGFSTAQLDSVTDPDNRVPALLGERLDARAFGNWLKAEKPDVVVTDQPEALEWARSLGIEVPGRLGLMHLDWGPHLEGWAGMDQNNRVVGAAAADLVIGQTVNNELGLPSNPRLVLIESTFTWGPSVREMPEAMARMMQPPQSQVVSTRAIVAAE